MADKKEFIGLIKDKCSGKPYDINNYVDTMDKLMANIYKTRYGGLFHTQPMNGFLQVGFDVFRNYCWEELEDKSLIFKFSDATFLNDGHLFGYIRKTFENLLKDKIYKFTPGFQTRMKQVARVLKPNVLDACKKLCRCWKLLEFRDASIRPANLGKLLDISKPLSLPKLHIPKKPGSERGPSIYDKEMEEYLLSLLKGAGGMTTQADLRSFITIQYGLHPFRRVSLPAREHADVKQESEEDHLSRIACGTGDVLLGSDHCVMAKELIAGMTPEMKEVYYHRIVDGRTFEETAREMKKSTGTIHGIEAGYKENFQHYFRDSDTDVVPEEETGIIDLVSGLILEMRGAS
jgi:hypothetical protein